jgi:hypothetical protein
MRRLRSPSRKRQPRPRHYMRGPYGALILSAGKITARRDKSRGRELPDRILTSHAGSPPPRGGLALARLGENVGVMQVGRQRASGATGRRNHHMARFRGAPVDYCPLYPGCGARLRG